MAFKLKQAGQIVTVLLFLLTAAICLTILGTFIYYPIDAHFYQLPQMVNLSMGQLMHNYATLMAYLHFPWVTHLQFPNFISSVSGNAHFYDVKKLFILNDVLLLLTAPGALLTLKHWWKQHLFWRLYRPFQVALITPLLVAGMASVNFNAFFIGFHHLFFSNSDWLFDPATDPIIIVLPEAFFAHCFIVAFVLFEVLMLLGFLGARRQYKQLK